MLGGVAIVIGAAGAIAAMSLAADAPVNTSDKAAIEKIVREYILTHPEILPEAMQNLEAREAKKTVDARRAELETPFGSAWEGAADADVTLVEFFDYACGYCRASLPDIERILSEDKKLRIVYREVPILGPPSVLAAQTSLAVAQYGDYRGFHRATFAAGRITPQTLDQARQRAGADGAKVKAAASSDKIRTEIETNLDLQRALGMTGTPGWVIGDKVLNGAVGYDELKKAIAEARSRKG